MVARDMMRKPIGALFLVLVVVAVAATESPAGAAESAAGLALPAQPVTLEGAVAYGLEHNLGLQAAGQEIEAADQGVRQAQADFGGLAEQGLEFEAGVGGEATTGAIRSIEAPIVVDPCHQSAAGSGRPPSVSVGHGKRLLSIEQSIA